MHATRAHLSAARASACGIPAFTSLYVLDHDKAYSSLDSCTVYPSTMRAGGKHIPTQAGGCVLQLTSA